MRDAPSLFEHSDKVLHMVTFAVLTVLALLSWPGRLRLVAGALLGYGVLIEVLQSFTPTRSPSLGDVVADAAGIALGLALARWIGQPSAR